MISFLEMAGLGFQRSSQGQKRNYAQASDLELKDKGNRYFLARKYEDAIQCYSNAIQRNPSNSIYYTNRALTGLR